MEFRSKIDKYFIVTISIACLVILAVFIIPLSVDNDRTRTDILIVLSLCVLSIGCILWIPFTIKYVFYPDHLLVKGGPFKSRIPYDKITRISPVKEIFTGYRLLSSKEGIELFYTSAALGSVKISPKDSEAFITELKRRCPAVRIEK